MKRTLLLICPLVLMLASCSKPRKYADTPKDLGRAVLDALKNNDVDALVQYYPTLQEAKEFQDDFVDKEENLPRVNDLLEVAIDDIYDPSSDDDDHDDKGFSDSKLNRVFENDNAGIRKDFKDVLRDAKDKDINWSKVKLERIQLPETKKRRNGSKPAWICIWCKNNKGQKFYVVLENCIKTEKGWRLGLSMQLSEDISATDDELKDSMIMMDSTSVDP